MLESIRYTGAPHFYIFVVQLDILYLLQHGWLETDRGWYTWYLWNLSRLNSWIWIFLKNLWEICFQFFSDCHTDCLLEEWMWHLCNGILMIWDSHVTCQETSINTSFVPELTVWEKIKNSPPSDPMLLRCLVLSGDCRKVGSCSKLLYMLQQQIFVA